MSTLGNLLVLILTLIGLELVGMDGMLIILCWLTMGILLMGFIGEMLRPTHRR